jgi:hypothetical protein
MVAVAPPKRQPVLQAPRPAEPGSAAQAAEQLSANTRAEMHEELLPDHLDISLDNNAGRFVQTLTDVQTNETKLRFPSESQLAYARAVKAYLKAQFGR